MSYNPEYLSFLSKHDTEHDVQMTIDHVLEKYFRAVQHERDLYYSGSNKIPANVSEADLNREFRDIKSLQDSIHSDKPLSPESYALLKEFLEQELTHAQRELDNAYGRHKIGTTPVDPVTVRRHKEALELALTHLNEQQAANSTD